MSNNSLIGERIKNRRLELNLTQNELADRLNLKNRSTITYYEKGEKTFKQSQIVALAKALDTTPAYLMGWEDNTNKNTNNLKDGNKINNNKKGIKIPVLGKVIAGVPVEAIEEVIDYEEITEEMAKTGEFFGLVIKGDSMAPRMLEGDVVIVKKQPDVESGDTAIILVNGDCSTVKKVIKSDIGITLVANNPVSYPPRFYSNQEIAELPVQIIGKVVELRGKF